MILFLEVMMKRFEGVGSKQREVVLVKKTRWILGNEEGGGEEEEEMRGGIVV